MSDTSAYYAANPPVGPATQAWAAPEEQVGTERPPRRWRFLPRSLSGRLVIGVVALVVLLVAVVGTATYFALSSFLYQRLDQQVEATAAQSVGEILRRPSSPTAQTIWIAQIDPTGGVLDKVPTAGPVRHMSLTAEQRISLASGQLSPRTVTTTDGVTLRVIAEPQPNLVGVVVIGLSTQEVHSTLHRLVVLELLIGAGAVLVAFVVTSWGVRRSLRNLYRVTDTAQEVATELSPDGAGLDRRVPVTEEGTEVGQLAESMNTLLSAVETQFAARLESEHRMRQFLADASHELRTPLTSIRGYAELARMRGSDPSNTYSDDLARIEAEGTRMSRLVDDLLTLTRSDQSDAQPQPQLVDVAEVLEDVVDGARAAFPQRRIDLTTPHGLNVVGDPDQLVRVVRNLVTNAAVHTDSAGPITVSADRDGMNVILRVADSGPGLPPEEAEHVFERFWRADRARTRARGGSGLGMSIVASLVRANGGTVRFDSSVEDGSTVTVRLPAATS